MSFRIEEKIPVSLSEGSQLIESLKNKGLSTLFPPRLIESCYFDTSRYDLYRDSEEGLLPRKKMRIRQYPQSQKNQQLLESKISAIEGRFKTSKTLDEHSAMLIYNNGFFDAEYGVLHPKVTISYTREYYFYEGTRITMDTNITYQEFNQQNNKAIEEMAVIELKAPANTSLDFLIMLVNERRRLFSK